MNMPGIRSCKKRSFIYLIQNKIALPFLRAGKLLFDTNVVQGRHIHESLANTAIDNN